jgi:hypothetical protein
MNQLALKVPFAGATNPMRMLSPYALDRRVVVRLGISYDRRKAFGVTPDILRKK